MIAVDTNIIVRLIVGDDEQQVARVFALAACETLYVSLTVLIETEWVLRSRYGYDRALIAAALRHLPELVHLRFEHEDDAIWAIEHYALAGELADYAHLAVARAVGRFATFEVKLARRAGDRSPAVVIVPE